MGAWSLWGAVPLPSHHRDPGDHELGLPQWPSDYTGITPQFPLLRIRGSPVVGLVWKSLLLFLLKSESADVLVHPASGDTPAHQRTGVNIAWRPTALGLLGSCPPAWPQPPTANSAKDRPTVRTKDSLAWASGASLQNLGILNQLLWQVWPGWLSEVHPPPGRSPTSCWRVWGGCAGHWPRQQGRQRLEGAGGCRRARHPTWVTTAPARAEWATQILQPLRQARAVGQTWVLA